MSNGRGKSRVGEKKKPDQGERIITSRHGYVAELTGEDVS